MLYKEPCILLNARGLVEERGDGNTAGKNQTPF